MKKISIVTPCYNEQDNVQELCSRIRAVMSKLPYRYEHICIDNDSTDSTIDILKKIAANDNHLKIIINARNFGHIRSPYHAILQSSGDAVVLLASDLQDPPEMISDFVSKWEDGYKVVMAVKPSSQESKLMFRLRQLYYKIITSISEVPLIQNATGAGLFDKTAVDYLRNVRDPYPYFRGLICEYGFPIATIAFNQPRRTRGFTKNNFYTLYDIAMLGIVKHSKLPLRLMTFVGFISAVINLLISFIYLIIKILYWNSFEIGVAPLIIGVFFFNSILMISMGLLGEYVGAIYTQVRNLPHVVEKERINFGNEV